MASRSDYLQLHFIVFLWGFSAILGKLVSIPAVEMVFYRALLATAGMGIVIWLTKGTFRVTNRQFIHLFLIGVVVAIHWMAFFGSARVSNVSVSLVGFATNSLWAAFLEPVFNKTRIKKSEVFLGLLVILGLSVIFSFNFDYPLGLGLGILAGFTSALFSVFNSRMVKDIPAFTITFYEMMAVFISIGFFLPVYQIYFGETVQLIPSAMDWFYMALLAGGCSVYAYSVAVELMKKISVFLLQLTLNLEPLYGIIMAVIVFGQQEKMNFNFYVGTAIILCAVGLYPLFRMKTKLKSDSPSR